MPARQRQIIGHHLIWTLYGHWLANDPRGSGSVAVRDPRFAELGEVHFGRKREQPSRRELREFYREAAPRLEFRRFWIDEAKRQAIATAIGEVVAKRPYTVWACAILSNHVHMVVRRHRDDGAMIWRTVAGSSAALLRRLDDVSDVHPVWAARPSAVFLWTSAEVRSRVSYVERNPEKEDLARQRFAFVTPYDGWPFHEPARRLRSSR